MGKTLGGTDQDKLLSFSRTNDNGFILAGSSQSGVSGHKSQPSVGGYDFWVVKLDANGNKIWDRTYGGNYTDYPYTLLQTAKGFYVIGCGSDSSPSGDKSQYNVGDFDFWLLKLDANGDKIWDKTIGGSDSDVLFSLKENSKEELFLAGRTFSGVNGDKQSLARGASDYWLVKPKLPIVCPNLTTTVSLDCNTWGINLKVEIPACQTLAKKNAWTIVYTQNGIRKTLTDSVWTRTLAFNPLPGTVFSFRSITSGPCILPLYQTITMPAYPAAPVSNSVKRCGPQSVMLSASGAAKGHLYSWYNVPTNGTPLQTDSTGSFTTPEIEEATIYYVAIQNEAGCEGPRTQVLVELNHCPPLFIPNIITQNHDGKNDFFKPQSLAPGNWNLQVYNRWGKKIYESKNYQNSWPEEKVNAGTYYFLL